ncbi:MAG: M23 family metallopeptidase [Bacteroidota bacterium]
MFQLFGQDNDAFYPPLKIPMHLSGNFGEIRSDHFHSGIDIKTQGTIGHRVYSIDCGYISRIKVQANGYGKSIYITHPGGYTSVYGHLDRYRDDIAEHVKRMQYKQRSFKVDLYLKPDQFQLKKGDFIAYSGNSGGSSGPHLHFEVRTAGNQHPTNVLKYGFNIEDRVAPRYLSLFLNPAGRESHVNGSSEMFSSKIVKEKGYYTIPYGSTIIASGTVGISVEVFDYLNGSSNRCGVYKLQLYVDEELTYSHTMDEFSFSETRYINAHINYLERIRTGIKAHNLYRLPNDRLRIYNQQINHGALELNEEKTYDLRVVATDVAGNRSELKFTITGEKRIIPAKNPPQGFVKSMKYNLLNRYDNGEVIVEIPPKALYQDMDFTFERTPAIPGTMSQVFHIASPEIPVHLPYSLSIKTTVTDPKLQEKLLLITLNDKGEIEEAGGEYHNGAVVARLRKFGKFAISADTVAPEIIPVNGKAGGDLSERSSLRFTIRDDLSGIEKYEGYIDNSWVLFEYDMKNDLLTYTFDSDRIARGSSHGLELYVTDSKGNVSLFRSTFTW